jgi:hypothetical protein
MTKRRVFTDTLPLGTPVSFTHELKRKEVDTKPDEPTQGAAPFAASRFQQHWLPVERTGVGFVMGYRSLTNGYTDVFSDGEWGYESQVRAWVNVSNTPAAVVAVDLFRKPVLVPIDALRKRGDT